VIRIDLSLRNILTIGAVVLGVWLLSKLWGVFILAAVGLLLAAALMPYVDWLWRRIHNRALAVLIVVLGVLGAVFLIFLVVLPPMYAQGRSLWERAPEMQQRAADFARERGWTDLAARIDEFDPEEAVTSTFESRQVVDTGRAVLFGVFSLFTVFFLSAYFLLDARRLKQFLYFSTPRPWHPHIRELLPALQRVVGGYIRGQAITSASIFVFTFATLTILDVPNALALSAIAAIADLIPLVGVYILLIPITLAALAVSVTTGIIVFVLMVLYQQFEDRILIPRVYGSTLRLPTIAVVLAILAGAELLGLVGALLALPVAAGLRVVVEYFAEVRRASSRDTATQASEASDEVAPPDQPFAPDEGNGVRPVESASAG
jgi:predicted PurR-regulated permease PerM